MDIMNEVDCKNQELFKTKFKNKTIEISVEDAKKKSEFEWN